MLRSVRERARSRAVQDEGNGIAGFTFCYEVDTLEITVVLNKRIYKIEWPW